MDNELAKKQEKERMKTDRIRRKDGSKKRSLEEEMEEDTKIDESRSSTKQMLQLLFFSSGS
jgi:hypothetical protein